MTFEKIKGDIEIAEKALANSKLDVAVSGLVLLCEVYCLTPFHWQSFYLRVYDGDDDYTLQYAKPYIKNYLGLETVSASFENAIKAAAHKACDGKIVCGIKKAKKDDSTINTLLNCLPVKDEIHNNLTDIMDGISTVIINRKINPFTTLYFRTGEKFFINNYSEENALFLYNLFEKIEEVVGNSATRDKSYLCMREMYC